MSQGPERPDDIKPELLEALAEAMAHPVRSKLMFAIAEKSEDGVSVEQISGRIGEPKRKVRYHLDALLETGLVAIAKRRNRGGVLEYFYRVTLTPSLTTDELDEYSTEQAREMSIQVLKAILRDASSSVGAKIFGDRVGHVVLRVPGEVDEQGWDELGSIEVRTMHETQAIIARSRDRLKMNNESSISGLVALLLFEVPPWSST
jgi:DNA-binding transcriptional ArsR family regulator